MFKSVIGRFIRNPSTHRHSAIQAFEVSVATKQSQDNQHYSRHLPFAGLISLVLFVMLYAAPVHASVQKNLELLAIVVESTIWRLESGIELPGKNHDDFMRTAALQYEMTAIAAGHPQLLEEDYYRLGLSFVARHFAEYQLARQLLQQELAAQKLRAVRDWLTREIADLALLIRNQNTGHTAIGQSIPRPYQAIIEDLKQTLTKSGVR